jgi:hypothetical protein
MRQELTGKFAPRRIPIIGPVEERETEAGTSGAKRSEAWCPPPDQVKTLVDEQ